MYLDSRSKECAMYLLSPRFKIVKLDFARVVVQYTFLLESLSGTYIIIDPLLPHTTTDSRELGISWIRLLHGRCTFSLHQVSVLLKRLGSCPPFPAECLQFCMFMRCIWMLHLQVEIILSGLIYFIHNVGFVAIFNRPRRWGHRFCPPTHTIRGVSSCAAAAQAARKQHST